MYVSFQTVFFPLFMLFFKQPYILYHFLVNIYLYQHGSRELTIDFEWAMNILLVN